MQLKQLQRKPRKKRLELRLESRCFLCNCLSCFTTAKNTFTSTFTRAPVTYKIIKRKKGKEKGNNIISLIIPTLPKECAGCMRAFILVVTLNFLSVAVQNQSVQCPSPPVHITRRYNGWYENGAAWPEIPLTNTLNRWSVLIAIYACALITSWGVFTCGDGRSTSMCYLAFIDICKGEIFCH